MILISQQEFYNLPLSYQILYMKEEKNISREQIIKCIKNISTVNKNLNSIDLEQHKNQKIHNTLKDFLQDQQRQNLLEEKNIFIKVLLGKLFIQGFRTFKTYPETSLIVLFRKQNRKNVYHFLHLLKNIDQFSQTNYSYLDQKKNIITQAKQSIQSMLKRQLNNFMVTISFSQQMKSVQFLTKEKYITFLMSPSKNDDIKNSINKLNMTKNNVNMSTNNVNMSTNNVNMSINNINRQNYPFKVRDFIPKARDTQQVRFQSKKQFQQLKQLLSTFIDTFGNQQKSLYLYREMQKSSVSFSVQMLLNTLCFIIYQQTKNQSYSQIQSSYWTCFQKSTRSLLQDRKHLVLSGNGQICILQMIFLEDTSSQNRNQYNDMLHQAKKYYKKTKIKLYRLTNQQWSGEVDKINLEDQIEEQFHKAKPIIYKFGHFVICQF